MYEQTLVVWIAVAVLAVPLLIALFTSPEDESLNPPPTPINGAYRIGVHWNLNTLIIEMFLNGEWYGVNEHGEIPSRWSVGTLAITAQYKTEHDAEYAIDNHLRYRARKKRIAEERAAERRAFVAKHPPREVPPFRYIPE